MFLLVPFIGGCAAALMFGGLPMAAAQIKIARDAANAAADASETKTQWGLRVLEEYKTLGSAEGRATNQAALGRALLAVKAIGLIARDKLVEVEIWPLVGQPMLVTEEELMLLKHETDRQHGEEVVYMAALLAVLMMKQDERAQQA